MNDALAHGKPIFAVCLGAQLMVLGAIVESTGRIPVWTTEGGGDSVFSKIAIPLVPTLQGDCFSYPTGAVL